SNPEIFVELQIGYDGSETLADQIGLVGLEALQGQPVFLGETGHGRHAEFIGRPEDANGDLAAIGDEEFLDRHRFQSDEESAMSRMARRGLMFSADYFCPRCPARCDMS